MHKVTFIEAWFKTKFMALGPRMHTWKAWPPPYQADNLGYVSTGDKKLWHFFVADEAFVCKTVVGERWTTTSLGQATMPFYIPITDVVEVGAICSLLINKRWTNHWQHIRYTIYSERLTAGRFTSLVNVPASRIHCLWHSFDANSVYISYFCYVPNPVLACGATLILIFGNSLLNAFFDVSWNVHLVVHHGHRNKMWIY